MAAHMLIVKHYEIAPSPTPVQVSIADPNKVLLLNLPSTLLNLAILRQATFLARFRVIGLNHAIGTS